MQCILAGKILKLLLCLLEESLSKKMKYKIPSNTLEIVFLNGKLFAFDGRFRSFRFDQMTSWFLTLVPLFTFVDYVECTLRAIFITDVFSCTR